MAEDSNNQDGMTRRKFIQNTGLVAAGALGGGLLGGVIGNQTGDETANTNQQNAENTNGTNGDTENRMEARVFFKRQQDFNVLRSMTERIFPEDDNGPGAIELGVPYYIDRQLAGPWGMNAKEYMDGPFEEGADTQGSQTRVPRGDMFLQGVRRVNAISQDQFGENFFDLEDTGQQNEILSALENDDVNMNGFSSSEFFSTLVVATMEGAYCDPVYGGNRGMRGWQMKEFPGAQMAYADVIEDEEFHEMDPVSLHDHHSS
ncbi:gluconate 2-dehydrogenase subunit 3 family protein [Alkalicoccus saliphilus]|jgi:gluconate 2-dehydrogenase gamma chain|uniref:Dehydrogenase n=1 Tax=Alkalicoccus saliphilus TaxID=200989 RepID=A0A2T4U962_9BACI|nr:gluconate 2-dehydrogenase subunit 3 family protein [Alkalicoccus saliphilus]PTL39944.1 dehydrogenase [Alkalicoccus saliphilus]